VSLRISDPWDLFLHLRNRIIVVNNFSQHGGAVGIARGDQTVLENRVHEFLPVLVGRLFFFQLGLGLPFGAVPSLAAARFQFLCVVQARLRNFCTFYFVCGRLRYIQNGSAVVQVLRWLPARLAGGLVLHLRRAPPLECFQAATVSRASRRVVQPGFQNGFDFLIVDVIVVRL
jgi:hypothetical protein